MQLLGQAFQSRNMVLPLTYDGLAISKEQQPNMQLLFAFLLIRTAICIT